MKRALSITAVLVFVAVCAVGSYFAQMALIDGRVARVHTHGPVFDCSKPLPDGTDCSAGCRCASTKGNGGRGGASVVIEAVGSGGWGSWHDDATDRAQQAQRRAVDVAQVGAPSATQTIQSDNVVEIQCVTGCRWPTHVIVPPELQDGHGFVCFVPVAQPDAVGGPCYPLNAVPFPRHKPHP